MNTPLDLPSDTLAFFDVEGVLFAILRIAPGDRDDRADCIFDVVSPLPTDDPAARWLAKRHYRQTSEHRLTRDDEGRVTIRKASFELVLEPDEDDPDQLVSRPPAPRVLAAWETD
jgi:hypothetical protein